MDHNSTLEEAVELDIATTIVEGVEEVEEELYSSLPGV